jgi:hypothetical protein
MIQRARWYLRYGLYSRVADLTLVTSIHIRGYSTDARRVGLWEEGEEKGQDLQAIYGVREQHIREDEYGINGEDEANRSFTFALSVTKN